MKESRDISANSSRLVCLTAMVVLPGNYAARYGLDALGGDGNDSCVGFDTPKCGNWNWVEPAHQLLTRDPTRFGSHDWDQLEHTFGRE